MSKILSLQFKPSRDGACRRPLVFFVKSTFEVCLQLSIENIISDSDNQTTARDENHSLLTVMETEPHSMSLMVKPKDYNPDTMIRLLYERVPQHRKPIMQYLNDPVIEYIPLARRVQSHNLTELPMGKYIVCGEAMVHGEVNQASCFETRIERLDNNSE